MPDIVSAIAMSSMLRDASKPPPPLYVDRVTLALVNWTLPR